MGKEDVVIINQPGNLEQRTSKTGKVRYSIKVTSEPLAFNLNAKELGQDVAASLAHYFREQIKGTTQQAAPATIEARKRFAKAAAQGRAWALRRYSGGQIGASQPNSSDRLFNDSGRFAQSIVARATGDNWRINVAGSRLDARTANNGGMAAVERIWGRLVQLVPAFADVSIAFASNEVLKARARMQQRLVQKMPATSKNMSFGEAAAKLFNVARQIGAGLGDLLAG
jgi:hypothetical protein